MKKYLLKFDKHIGALVGRLPKKVYRPFDVLCVVARPSFWALVLVVAAVALFAHGEDNLAWAAVAALMFIPLSTFAKFATRRQRPINIYTDTMKIKSYSFPSSHAYAAALGGGFVIVLLLSMGGGLAVALSVMLALLVLAIGAARVYLGAHFPSDVVGGFVLGIIVLAAITNITGVV